MRITVLGKSPAWQDADGACSGYLVEGGGQVVLLDCGPGVFAKLRRFVDYVDVDAVVISHLHADHILDLVPFASGLRYAPRQQPVPVARLPRHRPSGAAAADRAAGRAGGVRGAVQRRAAMTADHIELAFDVTIYDPADDGGARRARRALPARPALHPGQRGRVRRGRRALHVLRRLRARTTSCARSRADTDLLLIEATLPRPERDGERGHLTPEEAGEHGAAAGARRLVLTHFSDELDVDWARAEAARAFGRPVDAAHEGATYEVGG